MTEDVNRRIAPADLSALLKASMALAESLDLESVLQVAIESVVEVLGLETGAIYLVADDRNVRLGAATPALPPEFGDEFRVISLVDHPHVAEANATGGPVFISDTSEADLTAAERRVCEARGLRSLLYVPLMIEGAAAGTCIVGTSTHVHVFDDVDIVLCRTLSAQIALAVANARLYEQTQVAAAELACAYDATLEGWALALEMRDAETLGHTVRSAGLAVEMASALGVPEAELRHVHRGALLHDIGKMVVPDSVLNKPGPLDDEEWVVMRRHPEYARDFLSRIDYLRPALDIPYCHHERWDGTGYPQGLAREAIPLPARVFAVIDVYDALTSDRPYRKAWSRADALAHIRSGAGTHFDPAVVDVFLDLVDGASAA
ncbi:MAG: HD domain-containing phosphohydrolase [Actinomycetota bacterium]|nr:HD domain-containing phosphohydrolase [Actinomycetota bacterium]